MNTTDRQITFSALSYLLSYPDEEWRAEHPEWEDLINEIENQHIREKLLHFVKSSACFSQQALIEHYVYTFDFGKKRICMSPTLTQASKGNAALNCCS